MDQSLKRSSPIQVLMTKTVKEFTPKPTSAHNRPCDDACSSRRPAGADLHHDDRASSASLKPKIHEIGAGLINGLLSLGRQRPVQSHPSAAVDAPEVRKPPKLSRCFWTHLCQNSWAALPTTKENITKMAILISCLIN